MKKIFLFFCFVGVLFADSENGWNELHKAVYEQNISKVTQIIKSQKIGIDSKSKAELSPLHMAVKQRDLEIVKFLVESGADVNIQDGSGFSPLYYAVVQNLFDISKYLLKHEANPNLQNNIGNAPLHQIAFKGKFELMDLLLENGANPNLTNNNGLKPLHFAQKNGGAGIIAAFKSITKDEK